MKGKIKIGDKIIAQSTGINVKRKSKNKIKVYDGQCKIFWKPQKQLLEIKIYDDLKIV